MFHYQTDKKNNNTCIISCYYKGFHSDLYDIYFDDLVKSHIEFSKFNNMDYYCFNGAIKKEFNISDDFAHACVGIMKWFSAWYAINNMGYENVIVVDIDTKFMKNELIDKKILDNPLAVSNPFYWDMTNATWALYAIYSAGGSEHLRDMKWWYNTGIFKVDVHTNFKPYLDDYVKLVKSVLYDGKGIIGKTPTSGQYKRRVFAPYDEPFLQYFIAMTGINPVLFSHEYNTGLYDDNTVHYHFTDKSLIPKKCIIGSNMLNHNETN